MAIMDDRLLQAIQYALPVGEVSVTHQSEQIQHEGNQKSRSMQRHLPTHNLHARLWFVTLHDARLRMKLLHTQHFEGHANAK